MNRIRNRPKHREICSACHIRSESDFGSLIQKMLYRRDTGLQVRVGLRTMHNRCSPLHKKTELVFFRVHTVCHHRIPEKTIAIITLSIVLRIRTKFLHPGNLRFILGKVGLEGQPLFRHESPESFQKPVGAGGGKARCEDRTAVPIGFRDFPKPSLRILQRLLRTVFRKIVRRIAVHIDLPHHCGKTALFQKSHEFQGRLFM